MSSQIEFGYLWWLTYGHLPIIAVGLSLWLLGCARRWPRAPMFLIGAVTLWAIAAFGVARFGLNANGRLSLPTQKFLTSGTGRVLDMGAGTGRSSLMVLKHGRKQPWSRCTCLPIHMRNISDRGTSGQERLLANLRAADVEKRAAVQTGDIRKVPFKPATFDGIVSTYAIDHLSRAGVVESLREAARVLKPGGDFLLMVLSKDS